jgi:DNA replication protein
MDDFRGFPGGELRTTPVPDVFFSHVLPAISDEAELRVTLHVLWLCHRAKGRLRSVSGDALLADATLRRSLSAEASWTAAVQRGLDAAVQRGTLLSFVVGDQVHYGPNTSTNRAALTALRGRSVEPAERAAVLPPPASPATAAQQLYERYIGLVTPIIAKELAEAEKEYPQQWLADAFAEAASRDRRSWRYVQAILRGWASRGKR